MEKIEVLENDGQHLFLKPLLHTSTLLITFQGETEALTVSINGQGEMRKTAASAEESHLTFYGNQTEIIHLLHGDISLQKLIQSGRLKVKGSFRALLKLEAILWLTNGFFQTISKRP
ncbi:SCP2 sterol-binding domain-containing protein [Bacillus sp. ISL-51]|uniref:SCP2 sterol-binding domain-containing protein n=1 Tax=Bacteria TaxID=2 RepID=UPI001BE92689|nr:MULTISPECIES: SCP2 sterol-binding domain-containing protein [unclassified Bacillus (in: firmicutes)]MBT2574785.1 SCP2 sterol-binding domain-containing protein [Bacillus sp. ISL-51]MBT2635664.1 SCP2 sterol-binding domain-containing protein [Bacillus sp. ISL-26]MBT2714259.1 SCP2 sterol-binding domain-containing protein [Pseudomonas sp. ISL-88]